jgi:hypothetical protein
MPPTEHRADSQHCKQNRQQDFFHKFKFLSSSNAPAKRSPLTSQTWSPLAAIDIPVSDHLNTSSLYQDFIQAESYP